MSKETKQTAPGEDLPLAGYRALYSTLIVGVYTFALISNALTLTKTPLYGWDMLAYTALTFSHQSNDPEFIFRETFGIAKRKLPASWYRYLTGETYPGWDKAYRIAVAHDAGSFYQQLRFYRVKALYNFLIRSGTWFGLDAIEAGMLVSVISYLGIGVFLFLLLNQYVHTGISAGIAYYVISHPLVMTIGRRFTPDALSVFFLLAAFYVYLVTKDPRKTILLLLVSTFVRLDNSILCGLLLVYFAIIGRLSWKEALLFLVIEIALFAGLVMFTEYYGWQKHFYVTYVDRVVEIEHFSSPLKFEDYVRLYPLAFLKNIQESHLSWIFLIGCGVLLMNREVKPRDQIASLSLWISVLLLAMVRSLLHDLPGDGWIFVFHWTASWAMVVSWGLLLMMIVTKQPNFLVKQKSPEIDLLVIVLGYLLIHLIVGLTDKDRMLMGGYLFVIVTSISELTRRVRRMKSGEAEKAHVFSYIDSN